MSSWTTRAVVATMGFWLAACSGNGADGDVSGETACDPAALAGLCTRILECGAGGSWASHEECESGIAAGTYPTGCENPAGWAACLCENYGFTCDLLAEDWIFCEAHNCNW